jgi:hypothetical protein
MPPLHEELAALCAACGTTEAELRAVLEALALTVEPPRKRAERARSEP